jgi:hypothetical protein
MVADKKKSADNRSDVFSTVDRLNRAIERSLSLDNVGDDYLVLIRNGNLVWLTMI